MAFCNAFLCIKFVFIFLQCAVGVQRCDGFPQERAEYFKESTRFCKDVHRIVHQQLRDHWNFWHIWFGSHGFSKNNSDTPGGYRRQVKSLVNPIISFNQPKKINYFNTKPKKILKNNLNTRLKNFIKKPTNHASVRQKKIGKKRHSKLKKTTKEPKLKKNKMVEKNTVKQQANHLKFQPKKPKRKKLANSAKHWLKRIKTTPAINNPQYGKYIVRKHHQPKHKPRPKKHPKTNPHLRKTRKPITRSKLRRKRKKLRVTKLSQETFDNRDGYWIYPKEYPIKSIPWQKLSDNKQQFEKMVYIKVLKRTIMKKRKHHSRPRSQDTKSKPIKVKMNENRSKNTPKSNIFELELNVDPIFRFHLEIDVKEPTNTQTVFDCCPGSCCAYARQMEVYVASNPKSYDIEVSMPSTPIPYSVQVHVVNNRKPYDVEVYVSSAKPSNTRHPVNESNKWKLSSKTKPPTLLLVSKRPNLKPLPKTPHTTQLKSPISSAKIASTLQWANLSTHTNKDGLTSTNLAIPNLKGKPPMTSSAKRPAPSAISFKISTTARTTSKIHRTVSVDPIAGIPKWPKTTSSKKSLTNSFAKLFQSKIVRSTETSLQLTKKVAPVTAKLSGRGDLLSARHTVYTASTMLSPKITVKELPLKQTAGARPGPSVSLLSVPKMLTSSENSTSASHFTTKDISLLGNSMKVSQAVTNDLRRASPTFPSVSTMSSPNISGTYIKSLDAIFTDKLHKRIANMLTVSTTFSPKISTKLKQTTPATHNITARFNFTINTLRLTATADTEKTLKENSEIPPALTKSSPALTISPKLATLSTAASLNSRDMATISSESPGSATSPKNIPKPDVTKHAPVINIKGVNRSTTYSMEKPNTSSKSAVSSSSATPVMISPSVQVTPMIIRFKANLTEFTKLLGTEELLAQNSLISPLSTASSSKLPATPEIQKGANHISSAIMRPSGNQLSKNYHPTSVISSKSIITKKTVIPRTKKIFTASSAYQPQTTVLSQILPTAPKMETTTKIPDIGVFDKLLTTSLALPPLSTSSLSKIKLTTEKAAPRTSRTILANSAKSPNLTGTVESQNANSIAPSVSTRSRPKITFKMHNPEMHTTTENVSSKAISRALIELSNSDNLGIGSSTIPDGRPSTKIVTSKAHSMQPVQTSSAIQPTESDIIPPVATIKEITKIAAVSNKVILPPKATFPKNITETTITEKQLMAVQDTTEITILVTHITPIGGSAISMNLTETIATSKPLEKSSIMPSVSTIALSKKSITPKWTSVARKITKGGFNFATFNKLKTSSTDKSIKDISTQPPSISLPKISTMPKATSAETQATLGPLSPVAGSSKSTNLKEPFIASFTITSVPTASSSKILTIPKIIKTVTQTSVSSITSSTQSSKAVTYNLITTNSAAASVSRTRHLPDTLSTVSSLTKTSTITDVSRNITTASTSTAIVNSASSNSLKATDVDILLNAGSKAPITTIFSQYQISTIPEIVKTASQLAKATATSTSITKTISTKSPNKTIPDLKRFSETSSIIEKKRRKTSPITLASLSASRKVSKTPKQTIVTEITTKTINYKLTSSKSPKTAHTNKPLAASSITPPVNTSSSPQISTIPEASRAQTTPANVNFTAETNNIAFPNISDQPRKSLTSSSKIFSRVKKSTPQQESQKVTPSRLAKKIFMGNLRTTIPFLPSARSSSKMLLTPGMTKTQNITATDSKISTGPEITKIAAQTSTTTTDKSRTTNSTMPLVEFVSTTKRGFKLLAGISNTEKLRTVAKTQSTRSVINSTSASSKPSKNIGTNKILTASSTKITKTSRSPSKMKTRTTTATVAYNKKLPATKIFTTSKEITAKTQTLSVNFSFTTVFSKPTNTKKPLTGRSKIGATTNSNQRQKVFSTKSTCPTLLTKRLTKASSTLNPLTSTEAVSRKTTTSQTTTVILNSTAASTRSPTGKIVTQKPLAINSTTFVLSTIPHQKRLAGTLVKTSLKVPASLVSPLKVSSTPRRTIATKITTRNRNSKGTSLQLLKTTETIKPFTASSTIAPVTAKSSPQISTIPEITKTLPQSTTLRSPMSSPKVSSTIKKRTIMTKRSTSNASAIATSSRLPSTSLSKTTKITKLSIATDSFTTASLKQREKTNYNEKLPIATSIIIPDSTLSFSKISTIANTTIPTRTTEARKPLSLSSFEKVSPPKTPMKPKRTTKESWVGPTPNKLLKEKLVAQFPKTHPAGSPKRPATTMSSPKISTTIANVRTTSITTKTPSTKLLTESSFKPPATISPHKISKNVKSTTITTKPPSTSTMLLAASSHKRPATTMSSPKISTTANVRSSTIITKRSSTSTKRATASSPKRPATTMSSPKTSTTTTNIRSTPINTIPPTTSTKLLTASSPKRPATTMSSSKISKTRANVRSTTISTKTPSTKLLSASSSKPSGTTMPTQIISPTTTNVKSKTITKKPPPTSTKLLTSSSPKQHATTMSSHKIFPTTANVRSIISTKLLTASSPKRPATTMSSLKILSTTAIVRSTTINTEPPPTSTKLLVASSPKRPGTTMPSPKILPITANVRSTTITTKTSTTSTKLLKASSPKRPATKISSPKISTTTANVRSTTFATKTPSPSTKLQTGSFSKRPASSLKRTMSSPKKSTTTPHVGSTTITIKLHSTSTMLLNASYPKRPATTISSPKISTTKANVRSTTITTETPSTSTKPQTASFPKRLATTMSSSKNSTSTNMRSTLITTEPPSFSTQLLTANSPKRPTISSPKISPTTANVRSTNILTHAPSTSTKLLTASSPKRPATTMSSSKISPTTANVRFTTIPTKAPTTSTKLLSGRSPKRFATTISSPKISTITAKVRSATTKTSSTLTKLQTASSLKRLATIMSSAKTSTTTANVRFTTITTKPPTTSTNLLTSSSPKPPATTMSTPKISTVTENVRSATITTKTSSTLTKLVTASSLKRPATTMSSPKTSTTTASVRSTTITTKTSSTSTKLQTASAPKRLATTMLSPKTSTTTANVRFTTINTKSPSTSTNLLTASSPKRPATTMSTPKISPKTANVRSKTITTRPPSTSTKLLTASSPNQPATTTSSAKISTTRANVKSTTITTTTPSTSTKFQTASIPKRLARTMSSPKISPTLTNVRSTTITIKMPSTSTKLLTASAPKQLATTMSSPKKLTTTANVRSATITTKPPSTSTKLLTASFPKRPATPMSSPKISIKPKATTHFTHNTSYITPNVGTNSAKSTVYITNTNVGLESGNQSTKSFTAPPILTTPSSKISRTSEGTKTSLISVPSSAALTKSSKTAKGLDSTAGIQKITRTLEISTPTTHNTAIVGSKGIFTTSLQVTDTNKPITAGSIMLPVLTTLSIHILSATHKMPQNASHIAAAIVNSTSNSTKPPESTGTQKPPMATYRTLPLSSRSSQHISTTKATAATFTKLRSTIFVRKPLTVSSTTLSVAKMRDSPTSISHTTANSGPLSSTNTSFTKPVKYVSPSKPTVPRKPSPNIIATIQMTTKFSSTAQKSTESTPSLVSAKGLSTKISTILNATTSAIQPKETTLKTQTTASIPASSGSNPASKKSPEKTGTKTSSIANLTISVSKTSPITFSTTFTKITVKAGTKKQLTTGNKKSPIANLIISASKTSPTTFSTTTFTKITEKTGTKKQLTAGNKKSPNANLTISVSKMSRSSPTTFFTTTFTKIAEKTGTKMSPIANLTISVSKKPPTTLFTTTFTKMTEKTGSEKILTTGTKKSPIANLTISVLKT